MPKIGTFGPKSFGESWATDTYTGRALDKVMGGRLSQQVKANQIKAGAVKRGPGASMAASKASAMAKTKAAANSAVQGKSFMGPTGGFGKLNKPASPMKSGGAGLKSSIKSGPATKGAVGGGTKSMGGSKSGGSLGVSSGKTMGSSIKSGGMSKSSVAGPGGRKMARGGLARKKK